MKMHTMNKKNLFCPYVILLASHSRHYYYYIIISRYIYVRIATTSNVKYQMLFDECGFEMGYVRSYIAGF